MASGFISTLQHRLEIKSRGTDGKPMIEQSDIMELLQGAVQMDPPEE